MLKSDQYLKYGVNRKVLLKNRTVQLHILSLIFFFPEKSEDNLSLFSKKFISFKSIITAYQGCP